VQSLWVHRVQNIGNGVTLNMKTDEHLYTISRTEFAKEIGKSREAVKKDMQRGKHKDLYIFKNGKYFFKSQERMRANQDCPLISLSPVKPKVNRGGHEMAVRKGRYPNQAFANHNHMKKMIALRGKMTPEELALVPTVERMVKQERQKQLQESLELPTSRYRPSSTTRSNTFSSNGIYHAGSNKGYGSPGYLGNTYRDSRSYEATNRGRKINKKGPYEI